MTWLEKIIHPLSFSKQVIINGKPLCVEWTYRADSALRERKQPLNIEMELFFSCRVKKIVNFHNNQEGTISHNVFHKISDDIKVWFHPVISNYCDVGESELQHSKVDVDIKNLRNYYPKKLYIDFRNKQWVGSFC
ncbi:MAG: hypothetical protein OQL19_00795 [Gammaproteobacteria bacterium]|nr:hypothetical protein [Gammaproteobacteria bacterium]